MAFRESCSQANLIKGVLRSTSQAPPAHCTLNIRQFSSLSKHNVERYESNEFEAGGYKWKLVIHPNGNKSKQAEEFLSVYIAMADPTSLPPGWEVYATFRIFLLNHNKNNYLIAQDVMSKGRRFHRLRPEWGFDQYISLKAFGDSSYGYLVGDNCVFGGEVFVCEETSKGKIESLSLVMDASPYRHYWRIRNYSKLDKDKDCENSDIFIVGGHKWKIQLYPSGKGSIDGYTSVYLALAEPENLPSGTKILADFTLRIWDMLSKLESDDIYFKANCWFSVSKPLCGWPRFVSHETLFQKNRGFLFDDICRVVADVAIHGETTVFG